MTGMTRRQVANEIRRIRPVILRCFCPEGSVERGEMSPGRVVSGVALIAALASCVASCSRHRGPGPLSPEQSIKTFHLSDPTVRVELFAAEPDVVDPVEVVFDEDGRDYAAEM